MKFVLPLCALAAIASLSGARAFRIESTDIAPPADIIGEHQELEKTWTVYSEEALEKLTLAIPGPVFIRFDSSLRPVVTPEIPENKTEPATPAPTAQVNSTDVEEEENSTSGSGSLAPWADSIISLDEKKDVAPEEVVAKIVVSGNGSDLINLIELLPIKKDAHNGVRLHLKNEDAKVEGFVLTQIYLANKSVLRQLSTSLASTVDVAPGVLLINSSENKVKISNAGAGSVFVTEPEAISIDAFDLSVSGSGLLQLNVSSLNVAGKISPSVAGSGSLGIHAASVNATKVESSVSGSGELYVLAENLTASTFTTSAYGSGVASFHASSNGKTTKQKLTVAGSGSVYAGSLVANSTSVDIWGSGVAYVQVINKLKVSAAFSGDVYYVGAKPEKVVTSKWFFWRSPVQEAKEDKFLSHEAAASPAVYPGYVSIQTKQTSHSVDPIVKVVDVTSTNYVLSSKLTAVAHGPNGFLVFGCVALGLVVVGMAAQSYQNRRIRRHYRPLV